MTSLPPLSATSCAKCGAPPTAIGLRFYSADELGPYGREVRKGYGTDRMARECSVCHFEWLEAPRDAAR